MTVKSTYPPLHCFEDRARRRRIHRSLTRAADLIAAASHPVIVVGRGAMRWRRSRAGHPPARRSRRSRHCNHADGEELAERLRVSRWRIRKLFSTRTAIELFAESDCVIAAIGASLNMYTTEAWLSLPAGEIHSNRRVAECRDG